MNNNRQPNNNNRRRGRGNNNSGGNRPQSNNNNRNGFDYQNNIDNRARGNASQMLEKYKKLAADAQHNDDRVNAEYYLQFADHYFRVLADFKSRQEERQSERRPQRDDNRDEAREERYNAAEESDDNSGLQEIAASASDNDELDGREPRSQEGRQQDSRPPRAPRKERTARPPRRHHSEESADEAQVGLDLSVLPPSISIASNESDADVEEPAKPARKPRARRVKAAEDGIATAAE